MSDDLRDSLIKEPLVQPAPQAGDLERAVVWLRALDILIDHASGSIFPSISDTARVLRHVQHAMKRWPWKDKSRRNSTRPTQWLIDNEYDVQSLLWTVLHPIYGAELVDENYLPNWGRVQPRADLAINKLKLIIEVKLARSPGDFTHIEEQVGGDLGLYFKDTNLFDHMIVFVYDASDSPQPEKYDSLRNALMKRERINDVIIVQRPSMIPGRDARG